MKAATSTVRALPVALLVLLLLVLLLLALAWALQRRLVYFPDTAPVPAADSLVPGARDVELHTDDGLSLGAWLVPPEQPDRGVTVLVANGNGGNRSIRAPLARALAAEGMTVLLFDYRGYGGNAGTPHEEGLSLDVRAARDYLVQRPDRDDRLIYYGESLGAAVVTELATEHPPAAMVLRSPFVDLAAMGKLHFPLLPVRLLVRDSFPLADHLTKVDVPVTVVLGTEDETVPPEQSRAVAKAAPRLRRLVEVPSADHNSPVLLDGDALVGAVVDLADHVDGAP